MHVSAAFVFVVVSVMATLGHTAPLVETRELTAEAARLLPRGDDRSMGPIVRTGHMKRGGRTSPNGGGGFGGGSNQAGGGAYGGGGANCANGVGCLNAAPISNTRYKCFNPRTLVEVYEGLYNVFNILETLKNQEQELENPVWIYTPY